LNGDASNESKVLGDTELPLIEKDGHWILLAAPFVRQGLILRGRIESDDLEMALDRTSKAAVLIVTVLVSTPVGESG
jgi:hypothetical protein